MFTANIHGESDVLNVLDQKWAENSTLLKSLAQADRLVCPHCGQHVRLRAGEVRRWHFAHKQRADCPFKEQSEEVLHLKALLYQFLQSRNPGKVQMDQPLSLPDRTAYWDCVVDLGENLRFGYWIFDRQQRDRGPMLSAAEDAGMIPIALHASSLLELHSDDVLKLTASQRDFISISQYDTACCKLRAGHLNFLDGEGKLQIFRGLQCCHSPNLYIWKVKREGNLENAVLSKETGELLLPEDMIALADYQRGMAEEKEKAKQQQVNESQKSYGRRATFKPLQLPRTPIPQKRFSPPTPSKQNRLNEPFICESCGTKTKDWIKCSFKDGTCLCRTCNRTKRNNH